MNSGSWPQDAPASNVSIAWNDREADSALVGYVDGELAGKVWTIRFPASGQDNDAGPNQFLSEVWQQADYQVRDLDVANTDTGTVASIVAVGDPCRDDYYGLFGTLAEVDVFLDDACSAGGIGLDVELVGGFSEFDDSTEIPERIVVGELEEDGESVSIESRLPDESPLAIDDFPRPPTDPGSLAMRGTSGELATAVNQDLEAQVIFAPTGSVQPLIDVTNGTLTRDPTEFDMIHLSDDRYIVAYTEGTSVIVALYQLSFSDEGDPAPSFEHTLTLETLNVAGTAEAVALAPYFGGFALIYFDQPESGQERWTIRPYSVENNEFSSYDCESSFMYQEIDIHGVDLIARRDARNLVVQQANNFSQDGQSARRINVEGFIFTNFF